MSPPAYFLHIFVMINLCLDIFISFYCIQIMNLISLNLKFKKIKLLPYQVYGIATYTYIHICICMTYDLTI